MTEPPAFPPPPDRQQPQAPPVGPAGYPAAPGGGSSSRRPLILSGIGVGVVLVLVVGLVVWSLANGEEGADFPGEWDPRITHLVDYVEEHTGAPFDHPVHVDLVPEDEFRSMVTGDEADLTDDDRDSIARAEAQLRALGLVDADFDLFEGQNEIQGGGILAYYDLDSKRVVVRGTELTLYVEVTVVHELVNAWQDQQVDIRAVEEEMESESYLRYRAVVEGQAVNVERDYVADELSRAERREYFSAVEERGDGDEDQDGNGGEDEAAELPAVLVAMVSAPYALGPDFVRIVEEVDGDAAVIDMLREPPSSIAQLFDPRLFLDGVEPVEVAVMDAPEGAEVIDEGVFEILELYLVLASRIDASDALEVADGWAGGSYVAYEESDGTVCVGLRIEAGSEEAGDAMADGLETWARHLPSASVARPSTPTTLEVSSCDPGDHRSEEPVNRVDDAIVAPSLRLVIAADFLADGIDVDEAWCVADGVVDRLEPEEFESDEPSPRVQRLVIQVMDGCGVPF